MRMPRSSVSSFMRFVTGMFVFISLSFGITYAVNSYTMSQEKVQTAAAAHAALFGYK